MAMTAQVSCSRMNARTERKFNLSRMELSDLNFKIISFIFFNMKKFKIIYVQTHMHKKNNLTENVSG